MSGAIELVDVDGGRACVLAVRAQPGARRTALAGTWNGQLKLAVTAPPEDGRANAALAELLAELFELPPRAVQLASGATSRQKRFRLEIAAVRARARLDVLLAPFGDAHDTDKPRKTT